MGASPWVSLVRPERLRRRYLDAHESLFRQGNDVTAVYHIDSGRVRLVRHLVDGSSVVLHVARKGETLAEAALWAGVYHCDGVAETRSEVTIIPRADLLDALHADPRAALALARALASQVRDLRSRLELRNIRPASDRILAWLRLQASGDPPTVRIDRPWMEVAAEIGLTHEAMYRSLSTLEHGGRIARANGLVTLIHGTDVDT